MLVWNKWNVSTGRNIGMLIVLIVDINVMGCKYIL